MWGTLTPLSAVRSLPDSRKALIDVVNSLRFYYPDIRLTVDGKRCDRHLAAIRMSVYMSTSSVRAAGSRATFIDHRR
jgi:hypothetical protein